MAKKNVKENEGNAKKILQSAVYGLLDFYSQV